MKPAHFSRIIWWLGGRPVSLNLPNRHSGLEKHCLQDHLLDTRRAFWNFYFYPLCKIFLVRVNYSDICIYCTNNSWIHTGWGCIPTRIWWYPGVSSANHWTWLYKQDLHKWEKSLCNMGDPWPFLRIKRRVIGQVDCHCIMLYNLHLLRSSQPDLLYILPSLCCIKKYKEKSKARRQFAPGSIK